MRDDEEALQEVIIYMPPDLYPYQRIADQVIQYLLLFTYQTASTAAVGCLSSGRGLDSMIDDE